MADSPRAAATSTDPIGSASSRRPAVAKPPGRADGRLWLPALRALQRAEPRWEAVLAASDLAVERLEAHDARVPLDAGLTFLRDAALATGDPLFALRAALSVGRASFGVVAYLVSSQPNGTAAFEAAARLAPLTLEGLTVELRRGTESDSFAVCQDGEPIVDPHLAEYLLGLVYGVQRHIIALPLIRVEFHHAARAPLAAYRDCFGAPVHFGGDRCALVYPPGLDPDFETADPALRDILELQVSAQLAKLPRSPGHRGRVLAFLGQRLGGSDSLSVAAAAREMRMSERTLRRRLADEGTSFAELLDMARQRRALALIEDRRLTLDAVALDSGFASAGAFRRAFRRWTGASPRDYRRARGED